MFRVIILTLSLSFPTLTEGFLRLNLTRSYPQHCYTIQQQDKNILKNLQNLGLPSRHDPEPDLFAMWEVIQRSETRVFERTFQS